MHPLVKSLDYAIKETNKLFRTPTEAQKIARRIKDLSEKTGIPADQFTYDELKQANVYGKLEKYTDDIPF